MPTDPIPPQAPEPPVPIIWERGCEALLIAATVDPQVYHRLCIGAEQRKASIVEALIMARDRGLI